MSDNNSKNDSTPNVTDTEKAFMIIGGAVVVGIGIFAMNYFSARLSMEDLLRKGVLRVTVNIPEGYEITKILD